MSNRSTLIIDCQLFQTNTLHRGMGRYSLELLKSLLQNGLRNEFERIVLLFNDSLKSRETTLRDLEVYSFKDVVEFSFINISIHDLKDKQNYINFKNALEEHIEAGYRDANISFLVLSNFELYYSISIFPRQSKKNILLFYDLIPFIFPEIYLQDDVFVEEYFRRFKNIFEAEVILTISDTTRQDVIKYLGINPNKVISIGGAAVLTTDRVCTPNKIPSKEFLLFPSGDEWRKNNLTTAEAFNLFNKDRRYQLVVTSSFSPEATHKMLSLCPDILFAGNLSQEELNWFYTNSRAVIFPSLYEGLGLPVLEAIMFNKPVLVSSIPIFYELSMEAFSFCNPDMVTDICRGITHLLEGHTIDRQKYIDVLRRFNWHATGVRAVNAIKKTPYRVVVGHKRRVAIVGPHPEGYSAIGKFCQELLPALSEYAELVYYYESSVGTDQIRKTYVSYVWKSLPVSELIKNLHEYDQIIYNIGNSEHHLCTYLQSLIHPDTVILHDTDLSGLWQILLERLPELEGRFLLEEKLDALVGLPNHMRFIGGLCHGQRVVRVHSQYAKNLLNLYLIKENVINLHNLPVTGVRSQKYKNVDSFVNKLSIGLAGIISFSKGLKYFIDLVLKFRNVYNFSVFGFSFFDTAHQELAEIARRGYVNLQTNISDYEFDRTLNSLDVLVNLRPDYHGEASKTVLEAMALGVVPIVTDIGWFSELPDDAVFKLSKNEQLINLFADIDLFRSKLARKRKSCLEYCCKLTYDSYIRSLLANCQVSNSING